MGQAVVTRASANVDIIDVLYANNAAHGQRLMYD